MLKNIIRKSIIIDFLLLLLDIYGNPLRNNQCNWVGRSTSKKKVVTSVYLGCTSGRIEWTNPYHGGALIVVLTAPFSERNFDACFKVSTNNSRLSFIQNRSLIPLYLPEKNNYESIRCFSAQSTNRLMIYVESFNDQLNSSKNHTIIEYDLEAKSLRRNDECKPCTDDELSNIYCESDIVVRGKIKSLENRPQNDDTEILVKTSHFFRKNIDIDLDNDCDRHSYDELEDNEIWNSNLDEIKRRHYGEDHVKILISKSCGIVYNDDNEYVFMIKKKLSNFRLLCAPRLQDWIQYSYRYNLRNDTKCQLS